MPTPIDLAKNRNEGTVQAAIVAWVSKHNIVCSACGGTRFAHPTGEPVLLLHSIGSEPGRAGFGVAPHVCDGCGTVRFIHAQHLGLV